MLKSLTTASSTAAEIARQASMLVQGSDPKGLQIGRDGKGKRAGEMKTRNLDGLALYSLSNKVSSNHTRERKRDKKSSLTRESDEGSSLTRERGKI